MGVREAIDEKKPLVIGIAIGVIILVPILTLWFFHTDTNPTPDSSVLQNYYSEDDGATTFEDDATKVPPYSHNGKDAVRAYLFTSKGKKFVGYLERYSDDAKAKIAALKPDPKNPLDYQRAKNSIAPDVKKPGDKKWVNRNSPEGQKIIDVSSPDGTKSDVEPVLP